MDRIGAAWVLTGGVAVVGAQSLLIAPVLPDVAASLGVGPAAVGRSAATYGLALAVSAVAGGRLADRFPRRAVLRVAAAGMALGLLVCAGAPDPLALAAGQGTVGLAAGLLLPVSYALAGDIAPPGAETRVLGRVLVGWSVAMVLAVPLAAGIGELVGWRTVFVLLAALSAALVWLLGLLPAGRRGGGATTGYRAAARRPGVAALLLVVLAYMAAFYGAYAYLGDHVRALHHVGGATAGLIAATYGAGFGLGGLADGLADRIGPRRLLAPVVAAIAACYALLPVAALHLGALFAACLAWGLLNHVGLGLLVGLLAAHGGEARGPVMALYSGVTYLAGAGAVAALGVVYEQRGFTPVALAVAAALAVALLPALRLRRGP